jgi:hypothetical protein
MTNTSSQKVASSIEGIVTTLTNSVNALITSKGVIILIAAVLVLAVVLYKPNREYKITDKDFIARPRQPTA